LQRSVHAFDPVTGAHLGHISATIQPNLIQLSDAEMITASRQEFVRLHSLTQADADTARYEVRED
jgi:hypothetical protein